MSGGAWEYVMVNYNKYSGYSSKEYTKEEAAAMGNTDGQPVGVQNSGYTGKCGFDNLTFTGKNWLEDKYYDFYTTDNMNTACNGGECKSHGLGEVAGWYGDYTTTVGPQYPWLVRGGFFDNNNYHGNFAFACMAGIADVGSSFRLVLSAG